MKVLIKGANAFVGRNLIASLEAIRDGKDRTGVIAGLGDPSELVIYKYDLDSKLEELNTTTLYLTLPGVPDLSDPLMDKLYLT